MRKISVLFAAIFLAAALASCAEKKEASPKPDSGLQGKIMATVNDVPITEYDVRQIARRHGHGEQATTASMPNMLETLVRNELIYQQSLELGLDKNPGYRRKLNEVEAQVREFQRQEMQVLFRDYVKGKSAVTDAEAQDFFSKNVKSIQTMSHVMQIYYKGGEAEITKTYKDIKSGTPFEKVAARRFPKLPKGMKAPWDLGYLRWSQIPPVWQGAVDSLQPGQVSDILRGPGERAWIIKVVGKTVDPKITFATEKDRIVEMLKNRKSDELYASMLDQFRKKSKVAFSK